MSNEKTDNRNDTMILKTIKKNLLNELLHKQRKNVCQTKRLTYKDISRILKNITSSIFSEDKCCIWNGYITNLKNTKKGTYINFYFKKRKVALHRLLYANFVGEISDNEYLKFSCDNRGKCCNINHLVKYAKNSDDEEEHKHEHEVHEETKSHHTNESKDSKKSKSSKSVGNEFLDDAMFTLNFD